MMKRLLIFAAFTTLTANAQKIDWAKKFESTSNLFTMDQAVDSQDNIIVVGFYQGLPDMEDGSGVYNLTDPNGIDAGFIAKYNSNGNIIWAKTLFSSYKCVISDIEVDANDQIYIAGYFIDSVDVDPGPGEIWLESGFSFSNSNGFMAKYTENGDYIWSTKLHSPTTGFSRPIIEVYDTDIYMVGRYQEDLDLDGTGTQVITNTGDPNVFVAKYDTTGSPVWGVDIDGTQNMTGEEPFLAIDPNGGLYVAGNFEDTVYISGVGHFGTTSASSYLVRYDANGNREWSGSYEGTTIGRVKGIDTDEAGNVYLGGDYTGTMDIDLGAGTYTLNSNSGIDAFIAKYTPSGSIAWASSYGGFGQEFATKPLYDGNGHLYCVASYYGQIVISEDGSGLLFDAASGTSSYMVRLDTSGALEYAGTTFSNSFSSLNRFIVDGNGDLITTGTITDEGDVDLDSTSNLTLINNTTSSFRMGFLAKYNPCEMADPVLMTSDTTICDSGEVTLTCVGNLNDSYDWYWHADSCDGPTIATGTSLIDTILSTQTYYITGNFGCGGLSNCGTITVQQYNTPNPSVVSSSDSLFTQNFQQIQWYLDGSPISGATDSLFVANQNGTYHVEVSNGGCAGISNNVILSNVGIEEWSFGAVKVFPNPATDNISFELESPQNYTIHIFNSTGKLVHNDAINGKTYLLDLSQFESGLYRAKIINREQVYVQSFVIR